MLLSLRKVSITNFRGVRDKIVLDYTNTPSGLFFIRGNNQSDSKLGSNGAGKSSLFSESFIWALTGRTSRSQRPGSDVENRQANGKTTEVQVDIALDGVLHTITRSRNPNNLLLNGSKIEQQELLNLLPLSDNALRKSVLIDQFGEMFLSLKPEAKSQIFTETLELDRWLRASDKASDHADASKRKLDVLERTKAGNTAALAESRDQFEAARQGENSFEDTREADLEIAIEKARSSTRQAHVKRNAYNDALKQFIASGDDPLSKELITKRTEHRRLLSVQSSLQAKLMSANKDIKKLQDSIARYTEDTSTCPECGQQVNQKHIKQKRVEIQAELDKTKKLVLECLADGEPVLKQIEVQEKNIVKLESDLVVVTEIKSALAVQLVEVTNFEREAKRAEEEVTRLDKQVNPFTKQCDALEARIEELRAKAKQIKTDETEINTKLAIYQFWQKGFREIRLNQIDAALAELEITTCRHAESLGLEGWRIAFATERETKKGSVSHGFSVALYPPGEEEPVNWEAYCGGEVQRWQLAVTFGLAEVLLSRAGVSTDFEILDEPTKSLSAEGIEDLVSCLNDRARDTNRRIFLIDHHAISAGSFDGVITVCKTAKRGTCIENSGGVLTTSTPKRERAVL